MNTHEFSITQDGSHTLISPDFGVSYHSLYGAIQESRHVFIEAGLRYKALSSIEVDVLEIGFGTGLNALMSLLDTRHRQTLIRYTGVEAYPISPEQAAMLNYADILGEPGLHQLLLQMHTAPWAEPIALSPLFQFTKLHQRFEELRFRQAFDIIYFDAFAPDTQPELWTPELFTRMYEALRPGGVLCTYSAKGLVKRNMRQAGFSTEALPGPPGKREMTRGVVA
jgi:tRNA U34 5-methylaminomethyl-2-thiouridine-forming methyltransferase MnmC